MNLPIDLPRQGDNQTEARPAVSSNMAGNYSESTGLLHQQSTESGTAYASDGETERNVNLMVCGVLFADVCTKSKINALLITFYLVDHRL